MTLHGAALRAHELKVVRDEAHSLAESHIRMHEWITRTVLELSGDSIYTRLTRELTFDEAPLRRLRRGEE